MDKEFHNLERLMAVEFGWSQWITPYSALPTDTSIRVLRVNETGQVRCSFKIVDLDEMPYYIALSYTWGNPRGLLPPGESIEADRAKQNQKHDILLEGVSFEVSENLHTFLVSFQRMRKVAGGANQVATKDVLLGITAQQIEYIWIDAICINQSSLSERAQQVPIMDRIYRQAQKVIVWLGPADSMSRDGMTAFERMATAYNLWRPRSADFNGETVSKIVRRPTDSTLWEKLGMPRISAREWYGVLGILRRSWFARAWTKQELALAREAFFLCGTLFTRWDAWYYTSQFLLYTGWFTDLRVLETTFISDLSDGSRIRDEFCIENTVSSTMEILHDLKDPPEGALLLLVDLKGVQAMVSRQRWTHASDTLPL